MEKLFIIGGIGLALGWWFGFFDEATPAVDANGKPVKALPPAVSPVSGVSSGTGVTALTQPIPVAGGGGSGPAFGPPPPLEDPVEYPVNPILNTPPPFNPYSPPDPEDPFHPGPVIHSPYEM